MIMLMVDVLQETLQQLEEHLSACSEHADIDCSHIIAAKASLTNHVLELKSSVAYQIEWLETYGSDFDVSQVDTIPYDLETLQAIKDEVGAEELQQLLGIDPDIT